MFKNADRTTNEGMTLWKLLQIPNPTQENLQLILIKLRELTFFNQFIEKFLKGSQKGSLLNLCGCFHMEHFLGGHLIFKEGDESNDKLYIIYSGSVALLRGKKFETFTKQPEVNTPRMSSIQKSPTQQMPQKSPYMQLLTAANSKKFANKLMKSITIDKSNKDQLQISHHEMLKMNEKYGETVRIMNKGDGFGEVALIENKPRGLTACAYSQDLYLLNLRKPDFEIVKQQFVQSQRDKKGLIFSKFHVENQYSTALLESLAYSFDVEQFPINTNLAIEGQVQKQFYIIQKGEVQLEKLINNQPIKVCILTKGQFVSEEIVAVQDGLAECTATVISQTAILMVINKYEFLQKFPQVCKDQLKEEHSQKSQFREQFYQTVMENVAKAAQVTHNSPAKQLINVKINSNSLRSRIAQSLEQQDISEIVSDIKGIYQTKYKGIKLDLSKGLFDKELHKFPKVHSLPQYPKTDNVLLKSFKKKYIKQLVSMSRKSSEMIRSTPMTVTTPLTARTPKTARTQTYISNYPTSRFVTKCHSTAYIKDQFSE